MRGGWRLVGWTALAAGLLSAALILATDDRAEAIGAQLRWTARLTALLFYPAFAASSLRLFWRTPVTAWLLANRRYLGVSAGVSHTFHLAGILAMLRLPGGALDASALVGGLTYAFLFAMMATSFDRSAAWLGRRRWTRLHTTGGYLVWLVLTYTFAGSAPTRPVAGVLTAAGIACLLIRLAALTRTTRKS